MRAGAFTLLDAVVIGGLPAIFGVLLVLWARSSRAMWLFGVHALSLGAASLLNEPLRWIAWAIVCAIGLTIARRMDRRRREARQQEDRSRVFA